MNDNAVTRVHWSFWLISAIALIWNVLGSVNFFMQMNPDMLDAYRESERAIIFGRPAWATGGFAIYCCGVLYLVFEVRREQGLDRLEHARKVS